MARRIELHAPTPSDEAEFLAAVRASRALHRPWVAPLETPGAYREYLERMQRPDHRALLVREVRTGAQPDN